MAAFRVTRAGAILGIADLAASLHLYRDQLGLEVLARHRGRQPPDQRGRDPGRPWPISGAQVRIEAGVEAALAVLSAAQQA